MKFYTLRLFQRAPAAPARGQWSPALNLQFCPHCQTLNDQNGATCTRCHQPLVAFARGPASLSTAIVGFPLRNRPAEVDDVMAQTVRHRDAAPGGGEVPRRQTFSGKLAMIMSAAALGVALYSVFGSGRFQLPVERSAEPAAGVRAPATQAGASTPGKGVDSAGKLPTPVVQNASTAPVGAAADAHENDAASVAAAAPDLRPAAGPGPAKTANESGSDSEPRLLVPDAEDAGPRGAIALAPDPVPAQPTPLRATPQIARVPAVAGAGPAGAASAVATSAPQAAEAAPSATQPDMRSAAQPTGSCTDAVKTLGLCPTPKN